MEVPIEQCKAAKVYKKSSAKFFFWLSLVIALYAVVLPYAYKTAGDPRLAAMVNAQKLADERWANESSIAFRNETFDGESEVLNPSFTPIPVPDNEAVPVAEFGGKGEEEEEITAFGESKSSSSSSSYLASFFGPNKDQRRAQKEFDEWKKKLDALSTDGESIALPPAYLPSAVACVAMFLLVLGHALFHLMCHWVVAFRAAVLFSGTNTVTEGSYVLVTPPASRGQPALVPVKKAPLTQTLVIEFQRQVYIYTPSAKLGAKASQYKNGVFTLTPCPIKMPLTHYVEAAGLKNDQEISLSLEKFGKNHLAVPQPSFLELLQLQLLSPLAIFQVFCSILWLLDEYWTYTLWTLASVVVFEATTVFQRTRTQSMLSGMAPKPSPIYVYRQNRWQIVSTKDLLPGDLISLTVKRGGEDDSSNANKTVADPKAAPGAPTTPGATPPAPNTTAGNSNIVPCDCVIVSGSAVVNEASLTGESVPQMKDALTTESHLDTDAEKDDGKSEDKLDMQGSHRVHVLFSGTTLVAVDVEGSKGKSAESTASSISTPPDGGIVAYVLRTGFNSSQGSLLQMIEFSQQSVSGDVKETGLALLMLFFFALMAAAYVMHDGLKKREKTTHELLLKCVIIITSVVPRQFPMQMAMAVNMALMALTKNGVFCTEPFRVPIAGKITHCLFDKTGTLTTDQMSPIGIIDTNIVKNESLNTEKATVKVKNWPEKLPALTPVSSAVYETAMILATCHSLVEVDSSGKKTEEGESAEDNNVLAGSSANKVLVGDPIEVAGLRGVEWTWDAHNSTALPGATHGLNILLAETRKKIQEVQNIPKEKQAPNHGKIMEKLLQTAVGIETKINKNKTKAADFPYKSVKVVHRHHFSSKLQRMSVVCAATNNKSGSSNNQTYYSFVKGSPEAIGTLLVASDAPEYYTRCYEAMAKRGLRVLALAYKRFTSKDVSHFTHGHASNTNSNTSNSSTISDAVLRDLPRTWVESDLHFAGFIAFECKIRSDSALVVQSLIDASHVVTMVTGDAPFTSLHVAKEVNICNRTRDSLVLVASESADVNDLGHWEVHPANDDEEDNASSSSQKVVSTLPFSLSTIESLYSKHNILATESAIHAIAKKTGGARSKIWALIGNFHVLSRMSPQGKAEVIQALQTGHIADDDATSGQKNGTASTTNGKIRDVHVLMCGDGGNDVGALKQADVGLALLSGHANANTTEDFEGGSSTSTATSTAATTATAETKASGDDANAEESLNEHQKKLELRTAAINQQRQQHMKAFQAKYTKEQQARMQEEIRKLTESGQYTAMFSLMKNQAADMKKAMDAENRRFMAMHGQVWDPKKDGDGTGGMNSLLASMDDASAAGGLPMIRPGDASVAAPFTSRIPSIRAVIDLIRQGRCTLLSALMQQQIMMLESTIAAYTLSALSLHNARSSERQMMASSWLIMTAAVSFSYASPLKQMHPLRPLRSLFHPAIILSTLGQAAIHIFCMTLAVKWATDAMGPEKLAEVTEFFRKARAHEIDRTAHCGEDDFVCLMNAYWTAPFMPNLLNTVVFLVETSQMISVFFANYKGRPWMNGMMENHALFLSVFLCIAGVVIAAWEMVPQLNELIQLAPFPDDVFRYKVVFLVLSTIMGTFLWDRLCVMIFAKDVFKATLEEAKKTSFKDVLPILKTLALVALGVILLGTGNILLGGALLWWYRSYNAKQQQKLQQEALNS